MSISLFLFLFFVSFAKSETKRIDISNDYEIGQDFEIPVSELYNTIKWVIVNDSPKGIKKMEDGFILKLYCVSGKRTLIKTETFLPGNFSSNFFEGDGKKKFEITLTFKSESNLRGQILLTDSNRFGVSYEEDFSVESFSSVYVPLFAGIQFFQVFLLSKDKIHLDVLNNGVKVDESIISQHNEFLHALSFDKFKEENILLKVTNKNTYEINVRLNVYSTFGVELIDYGVDDTVHYIDIYFPPKAEITYSLPKTDMMYFAIAPEHDATIQILIDKTVYYTILEQHEKQFIQTKLFENLQVQSNYNIKFINNKNTTTRIFGVFTTSLQTTKELIIHIPIKNILYLKSQFPGSSVQRGTWELWLPEDISKIEWSLNCSDNVGFSIYKYVDGFLNSVYQDSDMDKQDIGDYSIQKQTVDKIELTNERQSSEIMIGGYINIHVNVVTITGTVWKIIITTFLGVMIGILIALFVAILLLVYIKRRKKENEYEIFDNDFGNVSTKDIL